MKRIVACFVISYMITVYDMGFKTEVLLNTYLADTVPSKIFLYCIVSRNHTNLRLPELTAIATPPRAAPRPHIPPPRPPRMAGTPPPRAIPFIIGARDMCGGLRCFSQYCRRLMLCFLKCWFKLKQKK